MRELLRFVLMELGSRSTTAGRASHAYSEPDNRVMNVAFSMSSASPVCPQLRGLHVGLGSNPDHLRGSRMSGFVSSGHACRPRATSSANFADGNEIKLYAPWIIPSR